MFMSLTWVIRWLQLEVDTQERYDLLRSCPGMTDLVSWLDSIDRRPGLNELEIRLKSNQFNLDALRKCIRSTDDGTKGM